MVKDGNRLLEIIDQILAVARIENRGLSKELIEVDLSGLGQAIGAEMDPGVGPLMEGRHAPTVRTDPKALKLVVGSLVDNAVTHGASQVTVRCGLEPMVSPNLEVGRRPDNAFFVVVSDDGPGIATDFLPRIFEKFEKSSFSSGTGLGLYMARMVIEALGGSLAVASSSDGTQFQIAIPLSPSMEVVGVKA
jgi:signal transduction histidine kinase